jgi:hypothetical protein
VNFRMVRFQGWKVPRCIEELPSMQPVR